MPMRMAWASSRARWASSMRVTAPRKMRSSSGFLYSMRLATPLPGPAPLEIQIERRTGTEVEER